MQPKQRLCTLLQTARPESPEEQDVKRPKDPSSPSRRKYWKFVQKPPSAVEESVSTVEPSIAQKEQPSVQISRCERLGQSHQVITEILPKATMD